jgi:hypothetical protein
MEEHLTSLRCLCQSAFGVKCLDRGWRTVMRIKAKAVPLHATKALGGEGYSSYSFSTSALDGSEWSVSRPGRALAPGIGPPVPIVQETGWASPLPGIEPRSLGRAARSQTILTELPGSQL